MVNVHGINELFYDCQPETNSAEIACDIKICLLKGIEYMLMMLFGNPDAGI